MPQGKELEILTEFKDQLPPELFTQEFKLPTFDTPQAQRDNLRKAFELLREAGWESRDGKLVNAKTGEPFRIEFLGRDPTDERVNGPFIANLRRLGIEASLRIVDTSQYINRVRDFDFDIATTVLQQSQSPGQRAARLLVEQGGGDAGLAKPDGHQGSRDRQARRARRLRHRPGRSPCGDARARTASCCGATTSCRNGTCPRSGRPTGTVRHSGEAAELSRRRHRFLVDRHRQGSRARGKVQEPELTRMAEIDRRRFLALTAAAGLAPALPAFANTETGTPLHGISAFGDLKYPPGFSHFDYVNPTRRGRDDQLLAPNWAFNQNVTTFNTLNTFVRTAMRRRAWRCASTV